MRISDWSSDVCSSDLARTDTARPYAYGIRHHALWAAYVWSNAAYHAFLYVHCIDGGDHGHRSEEHTSELQSLMRISYAVFCLKKKKKRTQPDQHHKHYTRLNQYIK